MSHRALSERLRGSLQPLGYVSFLSALIHHGALVDTLTAVQVASPELAGFEPGVAPGPVEFVPIPRDLYSGWAMSHFEGDFVPVATPEKALADWLIFAEERGLDPRLDEIEWDTMKLEALDRTLEAAGMARGSFPLTRFRGRGSSHDQDRARDEALDRVLRKPVP